MKLIVGLGNPGKEYKDTRHNVGFMAVDALVLSVARQWTKDTKSGSFISKTPFVVFAKPQTFVNNSGRVVRSIVDYYKVKTDGVYVVHDDLDIELGKYKIQQGRGPKDHNGVLSVEDSLGTKEFWRVRIGVENRRLDVGHRISGEDYVLQRFAKVEIAVLEKVIDKITSELKPIL